VLVNRHLGDHPADAVMIDYAAGVAAAVDHLLELGHRRLALLLPARAASPVADRERGWRQALARARIADHDAPVLRYSGGNEPGGYALATALLRRADAGTAGVTAVVSHTDGVAHGALAAAGEAGVRVPDGLSVIGFDNIVAPFMAPPLCTFECFPHHVGARAVALLAARLRDRIGTPQRVMIAPQFVCRATCAPP
jgi:LacI family transcriptional regulator